MKVLLSKEEVDVSRNNNRGLLCNLSILICVNQRESVAGGSFLCLSTHKGRQTPLQ